MGRISDVMIDIEEMLCAGYSVEQVSKGLSVPIEWVQTVLEAMESEEYIGDDSMDGDHASALASAGWGTDEDYGCYGEDSPF